MHREEGFVRGQRMETIELNGRAFELVEIPHGLPDDPGKALGCARHIVRQREEFIDSFWLEGAHFPEKGEEPVICLQFTCPGPSLFRKRCRLRLAQLGPDGIVFTEGSAES